MQLQFFCRLNGLLTSFAFWLQVPSLLNAQKLHQFFRMPPKIPWLYLTNWAGEQALLMAMQLHIR